MSAGCTFINLQVSLMRMSPMKENPCRVLTMRIHQYLYGERRHYPCPLGVLYTNLQVSSMQMSRWRAQIHSPMEENSCGVLTRRIHQSRLRVDKDNPSTGQVQKVMNQSKDHEQRGGGFGHPYKARYIPFWNLHTLRSGDSGSK